MDLVKKDIGLFQAIADRFGVPLEMNPLMIQGHYLLARLRDHRGRNGRPDRSDDRGGNHGRGVMLVFAGPVSSFVSRHPTLKMLALSFLILIGVMLVAEGIGKHIEKGYIYSAMSFALIVEFLNLRVRALAKAH
jgi:hypothetical protein